MEEIKETRKDEKVEEKVETEKTEKKEVEVVKKSDRHFDRHSDRPVRPTRKSRFVPKKKVFFKKRFCFFCKNKEAVIDYKDAGLLRRFVAENGKISPRRFTGTCAKHQKKLSVEIKKARQMALLPFTDKHK